MLSYLDGDRDCLAAACGLQRTKLYYDAESLDTGLCSGLLKTWLGMCLQGLRFCPSLDLFLGAHLSQVYLFLVSHPYYLFLTNFCFAAILKFNSLITPHEPQDFFHGGVDGDGTQGQLFIGINLATRLTSHAGP